MSSPIIVYNTHELDRACNIIQLQYPRAKIWRYGEGFGGDRRLSLHRDIFDAIKVAGDYVNGGVFIIRQAGALFDGMNRYKTIELLIDAFYKLIKNDSLLFLVGQINNLPAEIRDYVEVRNLPPLTDAEIDALAFVLDRTIDSEVKQKLKGLSFIEAYRALHYDLKNVGNVKQIKVGNVLSEIKPVPSSEIAGLHNFREYYSSLKMVDLKGLMMIGVHGCGKTMSVNLLAEALGLKAYRLSIGAIMNQYVGESENRVVSALYELKRNAPVIALIDEADKVLSGYASSNLVDAGVMNRILAEFLYTMDEDTGIIFFITCNNIDMLPPELIRRLDDVWFVDLPDEKTRKELFQIYFRKFNIDRQINEKLLKITENLTCSEIATCCRRAAVSGDLERIIKNTTPLYVVKRSEIEKLRQWALTENIRRA